MTQLDQLLNNSTSQHGYWLINHKSVILGDLMELLNKSGLQQAILTVNDFKSPFMKAIYKKIDEHKEKNMQNDSAIMCPVDPQELLNCEACQ